MGRKGGSGNVNCKKSHWFAAISFQFFLQFRTINTGQFLNTPWEYFGVLQCYSFLFILRVFQGSIKTSTYMYNKMLVECWNKCGKKISIDILLGSKYMPYCPNPNPTSSTTYQITFLGYKGDVCMYCASAFPFLPLSFSVAVDVFYCYQVWCFTYVFKTIVMVIMLWLVTWTNWQYLVVLIDSTSSFAYSRSREIAHA